uniref:mitogen-activated protein kinase kinase n=1 Tax=Aquila chrysaetos chrysaetos TaxID=223781 RepID=A0A663E8X6_AQUCH
MAASSLEQKLSRLEAKLKQENREARRRIDLNLDISPARARPIIVITLSPAPAPSQRAALQLPLVSDGGGRAVLPEGTQHPPPPSRPRNMLGLPQPPFLVPRSMESIEIDQKLQEIMKQTGYLTVGGQRYQAEINDLENLGEIGSGTCGQVWKMRFRKTGHVIAVKQMRRSGNREENKRILMDLDVVLKSHDCPYIVQCFGTFITNTDVFIAMELMGTCAEKLKKRIQGPIPERILGKMTVAIVKALFYLKEKHGVIHRDVKPSNILLDERGQVKLCDFGISGRLVDSKAKTRSAGCAAYMAVELATGQFPYQNCKTDFEVLTKVLQEDPPLLPPAMGFSGDFQAFVRDWWVTSHPPRAGDTSPGCPQGVPRVLTPPSPLPQPHQGPQEETKVQQVTGTQLHQALRDAGGGRGLLVQGRHGQDRVPSHRRWPQPAPPALLHQVAPAARPRPRRP